MNIRAAKLRGVQAAAEVHAKLGLLDRVRNGLEQIDVFAAINDLGIPVMCRPLEGLLGAYFTTPTPGILVTTNRKLPVQRFTAAHELGHFWMKHSDALDSEESIAQARQGVAGVPLQEIEAEAFASEFLLPKSLIYNTLVRHKWKKADLANPTITYQLSLRLGVSYEATWRALLECAFINQATANHLKTVAPKDSKIDVLKEYKLANPWSDAFLLTQVDSSSHINASKEDTVVIELSEHSASGYRWSNIENDGTTEVLVDQVLTQLGKEYGSVSTRKIILRGTSKTHIHLEERRPWEVGSKPLKTFDLSIDFNGKEVGLPRAVKNAIKL